MIDSFVFLLSAAKLPKVRTVINKRNLSTQSRSLSINTHKEIRLYIYVSNLNIRSHMIREGFGPDSTLGLKWRHTVSIVCILKRGHTDTVTVGANAPLHRWGDDATLAVAPGDADISNLTLSLVFNLVFTVCAKFKKPLRGTKVLEFSNPITNTKSTNTTNRCAMGFGLGLCIHFSDQGIGFMTVRGLNNRFIRFNTNQRRRQIVHHGQSIGRAAKWGGS